MRKRDSAKFLDAWTPPVCKLTQPPVLYFLFYLLSNRELPLTKLFTLSMVYNGRLITAFWETLDFLKIFYRQGIDFFMVTNGRHASCTQFELAHREFLWEQRWQEDMFKKSSAV